MVILRKVNKLGPFIFQPSYNIHKDTGLVIIKSESNA
jgi:hypothetical protein